MINLKKTVTERAFEIADLGVELAGGFGVARKSEFERLFRDARMGRIRRASSPLAYEFASKFALGGVGLGDQRWGHRTTLASTRLTPSSARQHCAPGIPYTPVPERAELTERNCADGLPHRGFLFRKLLV